MSLCKTLSLKKLSNCYRQFSYLCTGGRRKPLLVSPLKQAVVPGRLLFWERNKKGGYDTTLKVPIKEQIKEGFKELKSELALCYSEFKEFSLIDPLIIARPGETSVVWQLDSAEVRDKFVTTSDSDHGEGHSRCSLGRSAAGRGLFSGYLDTRVPKDGKIKRAGYCAMRSMRVRKSFKRESTYNWVLYNTLVLKLRGDGRSYMLNVSTEGLYDISWNDIYQYVLYTRGGPYWQIAKIPFSKFVLGSKGRVQDKQTKIKLDRVTHFGIACGDKITGNFNLEIEYIGLEFDPTHEEKSAYEMYKTDKYIVGV